MTTPVHVHIGTSGAPAFVTSLLAGVYEDRSTEVEQLALAHGLTNPRLIGTTDGVDGGLLIEVEPLPGTTYAACAAGAFAADLANLIDLAGTISRWRLTEAYLLAQTVPERTPAPF